MGEAKRRADALSWGQPMTPDLHRCPRCRSWHTAVSPGPAMALSHVPTVYGVCADCRAVWEAYPADWSHDAVEASPCDNCAFSAGSPEASDREGWLGFIAKMKMGGEFACHKGAPILIDDKAGTVEFDGDWIKQHGRSCAGFVRAMQQWPDWLDHRLNVAHVLTTYDADQYEGIEPIGGDA